MSNLGAYQWITTTAKKVGGPVKLMFYTAFGGYIIFRAFEAGGKKIYKAVKKDDEAEISLKKYTVIHEGISNESVTFSNDEELWVLEQDDDVVLVHKPGDSNSPYYVTEEFLSSITDYKPEK